MGDLFWYWIDGVISMFVVWLVKVVVKLEKF